MGALVALLAAAALMTRRDSPVAAAATLVLFTALVWAGIRLVRARRDCTGLTAERDAAASQLDRRISELFSLQELSYVLSESIALERIVEQVARYALRFLQTEGAIVVLAEDPEARRLRVAAALGSLESLAGTRTDLVDTSLVRLAIGRERIEVAQGVATPAVTLFNGATVRSAAVVPLRAQGVTMGALAVADRQSGPFTTEDLWLLSTVATQASVVMANARLYEMVRRSKEEWETAFNALAEGVAVVDASGQVLRANGSLARIAELPEPEMMGRHLVGALFGDAPAIEALLADARAGAPPAPLVVRSETLHRTLRLAASPLGGPAGSALDEAVAGSLVVLVEDVTEQREMESQLIQNEKMASIGQLVSGVAHELNNPLTSIRGLAELLLERGPGGEYPKEHLRVIYDQAERAGRIVRNLLTFARKGTPEKSPVDLNDVVARTSLLISYEMRLRGIELESRLSTDPVPVLADRYELQQVLLNLVTNAVQAVSDLEPGQPRVITVVTARDDGEVMLRVRDSGPGVPGTLVPYLFTPFFTTKRPGQGTGLGLSLSYGIVESHGGRLTYRAPEEGGAEFTITLPYCDAGAGLAGAARTSPAGGLASPASPPSALPDAAGPGGARILVADNDAASHRILSALFAAEGHTVETARSAEQALRLAAEQRYDLVIADAGLATSDGQAFAAALLERLPAYRDALLLAGGEQRDDLPRVSKPFNLRDVRAAAQRYVG